MIQTRVFTEVFYAIKASKMIIYSRLTTFQYLALHTDGRDVTSQHLMTVPAQKIIGKQQIKFSQY